MRQGLKEAKRIVVKVGSSTLTYETGRLNLSRIEALVRQIVNLLNQGKEVVLVSSGAVAAGLPALGFSEKPKDLRKKLAAASVGQGVLLHIYEKFFREYGVTVGQLLLTREDTVLRSHYMNLRNTLLELLDLGVVPIINENDVVAIEEFKIGDNDTLSAMVASAIEADVLLILSDIDGLYTANPSQDPTATLISTVEALTPEVMGLAGDAGSSLGTGGMVTKLSAARIATSSGTTMVIAKGEEDHIIERVVAGEEVGTLFVANQELRHVKQRWFAFGRRLKGKLFVDKGARDALLTHHKSLLPVGLVRVEGEFQEGDTVSVYYENEEIARGLTSFSSVDAIKLVGVKTERIPEVLGINTAYDEIIHKDNLVLLAK